ADIIIATQDSSMGMAGPAMISGGGMGEYHPKEIGPASSLFQNGVIDLLVENEKEAISIAKQYLSYFQGPLEKGKVVDQKKLRTLLPQDRKYAYDIMKIIHTLADENSVLELRSGFAKNLVTCLARIEGKSIGIIANNTRYLGGAIDSEGADKASRFMQLCNAFNFPLVSLCDTPGFMVGPADEAKGLIRHSGRLFINAAALNIPQITIILRKAYGLGAMAMAGGGFHESFLTLAWPTGEFGAMGLEGAVKLGFKSELEKIQNPENKVKHFNELVEKEYEKGKSINAAESLEFDEVIDPAETRNRIITALATVTNTIKHSCSSRFIDGW
ncbi:MAG: carboxyl transferase domain-containing protein, partial [Flavobacteriaceae bacterium]